MLLRCDRTRHRPDVERTIYTSADAARKVDATATLLALGHAGIARARVAWDEEAPFTLYERASTAPTRVVARPASFAPTRALRRIAA